MKDNEVPVVIQAHYDLLLWLMERVEKFPRPSRPVLGDRIETTALEILRLLICATYTRDRKALLHESNLQLDQLRFPIGNQTSQFFANVYLNGFDHIVQ